MTASSAGSAHSRSDVIVKIDRDLGERLRRAKTRVIEQGNEEPSISSQNKLR
jgi:hypothetical protein